MKKHMTTGALITGLLFMLVLSGFANDKKYQEAMKKNILAVYQAQSIPDLQQAVNALERIGEAEKTKWEPYYYAAFGYVMMATRENEGAKKDTHLDLAMEAVNKAKSIAQDESEIIAMEGFVHMIRLTVDPPSRGQQYSGLAMQSFTKAIELNPENPRALALMARMQFGTAQFFNSSTAEACATAARAHEKLESYRSENPLAPMWGKEMIEEMIAQCQ
jgi:tetratricopeptide (TPR) repeat protein